VTIEALLEQLADLIADRVAARLNGKEATGEPDRLLTVDQAAAVLGVTPRWLYRRATTLPFARRLSRGVLRFEEAGLRRYMAAGGPLQTRRSG